MTMFISCSDDMADVFDSCVGFQSLRFTIVPSVFVPQTGMLACAVGTYAIKSCTCRSEWMFDVCVDLTARGRS